jgi:cytochrome P450
VLGNGLVTSEGAFWRRQRKLVQPTFLKARVASYAPPGCGRAAADRGLAEWISRFACDCGDVSAAAGVASSVQATAAAKRRCGFSLEARRSRFPSWPPRMWHPRSCRTLPSSS